MYASPCFRGEPWCDFVQYCPSEHPASQAAPDVRAIVRRPEGHVAVVADMEVLPGVANFPLVVRGSTRLAWSASAGETDDCSRVLPSECIRQVLLVLPDFADLVGRRGLAAVPSGRDDQVAERLAMRFFFDAFYPWES